MQPVVKPVAETAELGVFAVAQRQHGVLHARQRGGRADGRWQGLHLAGEGRSGVGRVAFAVGAGHEQDAPIGGQARQVQLIKRRHANRQAAGAQGFGRLRGQRLGVAGLGCVGDQQCVFGLGRVQGLQGLCVQGLQPPGAPPCPYAEQQPKAHHACRSNQPGQAHGVSEAAPAPGTPGWRRRDRRRRRAG
ncbi:hypothetical protein G6F57_017876 [Rhizopus arrhizus]|nr:hypothetical protein G6F57_017876 [Rhizopus arrhizus]